jgi:hypothetical protein
MVNAVREGKTGYMGAPLKDKGEREDGRYQACIKRHDDYKFPFLWVSF